MSREVTLGYRRKESVEMVVSLYKGEDDRYLYLECGRYVKKRIVSMTSRILESDEDDDEE